jgi:hypothetical protein
MNWQNILTITSPPARDTSSFAEGSGTGVLSNVASIRTVVGSRERVSFPGRFTEMSTIEFGKFESHFGRLLEMQPENIPVMTAGIVTLGWGPDGQIAPFANAETFPLPSNTALNVLFPSVI